MKAFVTGATGFIGSHVVRKLRDRGDDVTALVRSPAKARPLQEIGCEIVPGDLSDEAAIRRGIAGRDSVFHIAAIYEVGVTDTRCREMYRINVDGTHRVLRAAVDEGVGRVLYVSTVGYFGNTRGRVVDETFERSDLQWLSCYDETKYRAHEVATRFIEQGAPIVVAMPGGVYGPGDTSQLAVLIEQTRRGFMKMKMMPGVGFNFVHIDDVADGIMLVHDKGRAGEQYVLGGELTTMGDLVDAVAELTGKKPPTRELPVRLIKLSGPIWRFIAPMLGLGPNLKEMINAAEGVTYWAADDKARRELGYSPRDLRTGLQQTLQTRGSHP